MPYFNGAPARRIRPRFRIHGFSLVESERVLERRPISEVWWDDQIVPPRPAPDAMALLLRSAREFGERVIHAPVDNAGPRGFAPLLKGPRPLLVIRYEWGFHDDEEREISTPARGFQLVPTRAAAHHLPEAPAAHVARFWSNFAPDLGYKERVAIPEAVREFVLRAHGGKGCSNSECDRTDPRRAVDHVVPFTRGGSDEISNLQVLCVTCNELKRDDTDADLRRRCRNRVRRAA